MRFVIDTAKYQNDSQFAEKVNTIVQALSDRGFYHNGIIEYPDEARKEIMSILDTILPDSDSSKLQ